MRRSLLLLLLLAAVATTGCDRQTKRPSSLSVEVAYSRGVLVADYVVPAGADLGDYIPIEVWVESVPDTDQQQLVVRLRGPHVDTEPRIRVDGLDDTQYRSIWSERNGPPYEIWTAPTPLPDMLILRREERSVELRRRAE